MLYVTGTRSGVPACPLHSERRARFGRGAVRQADLGDDQVRMLPLQRRRRGSQIVCLGRPFEHFVGRVGDNHNAVAAIRAHRQRHQVCAAHFATRWQAGRRGKGAEETGIAECSIWRKIDPVQPRPGCGGADVAHRPAHLDRLTNDARAGQTAGRVFGERLVLTANRQRRKMGQSPTDP